MAATVLSAKRTIIDRGVIKVVVVIPTTVDGTSGAVANFQLPRCYAIGLEGISSNFNSKTLTLKAAPDGTNYLALPTAVSLTASGLKSVAPQDCGFLNYQVAFSGAPTATLTVTIIANEEL